MMTEVMERVHHDDAPQLDDGRNRFLVILVALLMIALVGLGSWLVYDRIGGPSLDAEIEQVIDDYHRAWETQDRAAMRAAVSEDFLLNEYIYELGDDGVVLEESIVNNDVDDIFSFGFLFEWDVELVGDAIVSGDGPWFVSIGENWVLPKGVFINHNDGIASYVVVEEGGSLKIANHSWAGLRYDTES